MGSLDVVGEARSWFFGVGLNARACFELCHRRTIAAMHAFEMGDHLIDGSFTVWRVDRCSYNRSLAGRSGSRPRNNSMNRSRNNRGWLAWLVNVKLPARLS